MSRKPKDEPTVVPDEEDETLPETEEESGDEESGVIPESAPVHTGESVPATFAPPQDEESKEEE